MVSARVSILIHLALLSAGVNPACPRSTNNLTSRAQRSVSGERLPFSITPVHYDLEIQIFGENDTFVGEVTIQLQTISSTKNITLNSVDLSVRQSRLLSIDNSHKNSIRRVNYEKSNQQLILELQEELRSGSVSSLYLNFAGRFSTDLNGIYKSIYKDENGSEKWAVVTQMEATYARRVFPCFDEPGMKATFNLTIIRPENMTSLANTRRIVSMERDPGWRADQFESTVKMSTYLLAFVVCEYDFVEDVSTSNQVVRIWSVPDLLPQTNYSLSISPKLLNFYEEFFNISYALPKLDLVQVSNLHFIAMENWGLILFQDRAILFDPVRSSVKHKQQLAFVTAHEISHQWFGNLVTMKWWNDLWLKEGFADYMMYLGVEAIEPEWNILDQFPAKTLHEAMQLDAWNSSHPLSTPVEIPDQIASQYDAISYSKGSSLMRMADHFLGRDVFQTGISTYLRDLQYNVATLDDLWIHLNNATQNCSDLNETDVREVLETWTLQKGYPVVTLTRNYNSRTANLTQNKFSFNQEAQKDKTKWHIPITFTTSSEADFQDTFPKKWLRQNNDALVLTETDGLPSAEAWVLVNIQHTGFYRVNYDSYNWNLLIQQLKSDMKKIHVVNRAQILDDILNLARAGYQNYHLALSATKYLVHENEYLPWAVAFRGLDYIDAMLRYTPLYGKWKRFVSGLIKPIYTNLTFFEYQDDHHLRKLTRNEILKYACYYEIGDCIENSQQMFKLWMKSNGTAIIAADLLETTACEAIKHGGTSQWEFAWKQFNSSRHLSEKKSLLLAMGCTRDPWLLMRLLESCVDGEKNGITSSLARKIIFDIGKYNQLAPFILKDFVMEKWSALKQMNKMSMTIEPLLKAITFTMNSPQDLKGLKSFLNQDKNPGFAIRVYLVILETIEANIKWTKINMEALSMWLKKNIE